MNPYPKHSQEHMIVENWLELANTLESYLKDTPELDEKIEPKIILDVIKAHKHFHKKILKGHIGQNLN